jgi:6,7-dimethyl-8-ribityllumazine synthase
MASTQKNSATLRIDDVPDLSNAHIGMIVSKWNEEITDSLAKGCRQTLLQLGVKKKNLFQLEVPGSFELPGAAKMMVESKKMDAIICLGCIVQGETKHFDFISRAIAKGIMDLNLRYNIPFIFGVLTPDTMEQARDRAGGKYGNKGTEAAVTALKMLVVKRKLAK